MVYKFFFLKINYDGKKVKLRTPNIQGLITTKSKQYIIFIYTSFQNHMTHVIYGLS